MLQHGGSSSCCTRSAGNSSWPLQPLAVHLAWQTQPAPVTHHPTGTLLQVPSARFLLRKAVLDAGAKQLDPFTVDVRGSLELYQQTAVVNREEMLAAEVQWLQLNHFDLVVSDVVPIVCAAAAAAGIPAVCVSNFSWGEWGGALLQVCWGAGARASRGGAWANYAHRHGMCFVCLEALSTVLPASTSWLSGCPC